MIGGIVRQAKQSTIMFATTKVFHKSGRKGASLDDVIKRYSDPEVSLCCVLHSLLTNYWNITIYTLHDSLLTCKHPHEIQHKKLYSIINTYTNVS